MTTAADQAGRDLQFVLVGGRPSLNLAATLGRRHETPLERIPNPATLGRWFVAAGLLQTAPAVNAAQLAQARELRETINSLVRLACPVVRCGANRLRS